VSKTSTEQLQKKITDQIREFDILALIHLLKEMDYTHKNIYFKGVYSDASSASLIDSIQFKKKPLKEVIIKINWGLLSVHSPLPSHIFKQIDDGYGNPENFFKFINFFNHMLFEKFIAAIYPEIEGVEELSWHDIKENFLVMMNPKSISSLHWAFSLVYPELDVEVVASQQYRSIRNDTIRIGHSHLGSAHCLGQAVSLPINSYKISLYSNHLYNGTKSWSKLALERFVEQLYLFLSNKNFHLEIFLIIRGDTNIAKVSKEAYLGYDRIDGGIKKDNRIMIFSGKVA
jgi:hypothetical protein